MNVDVDFVCEDGMGTGSLPKTSADAWPLLGGNKDLSYPVHDIASHMEGSDNDWLLGEHGFPKELRPGGWVYLRHGGRLGARVRVRGIGFRDSRMAHTGDEPHDFGPGPTIEVNPETWESFDIDLGDLADSQRQGYQYLITHNNGDITHLTATDAVPDDVQPDEPRPAKLYKLMGADGKERHSWSPGPLGGNGRDKIWGNLDCRAALNAGPGYAKTRVFFANAEDATAAGFRPCGTCRPDDYKAWKALAAV